MIHIQIKVHAALDLHAGALGLLHDLTADDFHVLQAHPAAHLDGGGLGTQQKLEGGMSMAHLDNTRAHAGTAYELTLCLTEDEVKILLPAFERELCKTEKMYAKYKDIQDGGEATAAQQNKLTRYEDEVNALESVVCQARVFLK